MGINVVPSRYVRSAYDIDYEALYRNGMRGIIFDIDNTLVEPNAPADERSKELFVRLKKIGFQTVILSNNTGERARIFAAAVGSQVVARAMKPLPHKYRMSMQVMGTNASNTVFIGDQLYTDIWGANNTGVTSILTVPLTEREEFWICWKRRAEAPVRQKLTMEPIDLDCSAEEGMTCSTK